MKVKIKKIKTLKVTLSAEEAKIIGDVLMAVDWFAQGEPKELVLDEFHSALDLVAEWDDENPTKKVWLDPC